MWDTVIPFANPLIPMCTVKKRRGTAVGYFTLEGSICLPYLALPCLSCLPTCLCERGGITGLLKYCMASPSPIRIALRHAPPLSYAYAFFSLVRARGLVLAALICAVKVKGASGNTGRQAATQTTETWMLIRGHDLFT